MHFEVSGETYTLVLDRCTMDSAGLFTARAQNPAGQLSCNGRLKVIRMYHCLVIKHALFFKNNIVS